MDKDTLKEIGVLWDAINNLSKNLNDYINQKDETLKADIDYVAIMTDTYVDEEEAHNGEK